MVLDKIRSERNEDEDKQFVEIFLSGLLHTDDRYALRAVARALKIEQTCDQRGIQVRYIHLIAHKSVSQMYKPTSSMPQRLSFAESMQHVLDTLRSGSSKSMPVIITIDEFDVFASHSTRQHLLYNLFDAAQSGQSPVLIIGLTHRFVRFVGF